jgi:hypothetical protein
VNKDYGSRPKRALTSGMSREKEAIRGRHASEEIDDFPGPPPDHRAMERMTARIGRIMGEQDFESMDEANTFLERHVSEGGGSLENAPPPATPLERAQELIYDAFETDDPQRRVELAERALEVSDECADAYVILAEETAQDAEEAKELYEAGVKAGERALGEGFFAEEAGYFWGVLETRPYLRAREGLAEALWALGKREQALGHDAGAQPPGQPGSALQARRMFAARRSRRRARRSSGSIRRRGLSYWLYTRALRSLPR